MRACFAGQLALSCLIGCSSFDPERLRLEDPVNPALPHCSVVFADSAELVGDTGRVLSRELPAALSGSGRSSASQSAYSMRVSPRLTKHSAAAGWLLFTMPSILTLASINLLGYPSCMQTAEYQVQVEFLWQGAVIATYTGRGHAREYAALYWGHSLVGSGITSLEHDLPRATVSTAALDAIRDIREQVQSDIRTLQTKFPISVADLVGALRESQ